LSSFAPLDVNLLDRRSDQLVAQIDILREAVARVRQRTFRIDAWVVLPDHMHCLWTPPRTMPTQTGETRSRGASGGLAIFLVSSLRRPRPVSRRWRGGSDEPQQTGERL
jgi:hypothetical protein